MNTPNFSEQTTAPGETLGMPIFVCGYQKSGTTLMASLLDGHSQINVFPEETFLLADAWKNQSVSPQAAATQFIFSAGGRRLEAHKIEESLAGNSDYSDFDFDSFKAHLLSSVLATARHTGDVLQQLVTAYAAQTGQTGKRYWVEKSPGNENFLTLPLDWYADLRAIFMLRDPRDVYVSYARKKQIESDGKHTLPVETFICHWGMSVWSWQNFVALHPQKGLMVRYEDLVRYPHEMMNVVCHFLNIKYESILETPTKLGQLWSGNSMHGDKFAGISAKPIGRWKNNLADEKLRIIEAYLGKLMLAYNYGLASERPSTQQMVRYWLKQPVRKRQLLGVLIRLYWPFQLPNRLKHI